jgi:hypothetical protein
MGKNRKRKRPYGESTLLAYSSASFKLREPAEGPRTPHSFFSSSYSVSIGDDKCTESHENEKEDSGSITQVVHRHVNGLCIVTIGDIVPSAVKSIDYVVTEAPASSAAEKRKRQAKMLKGGSVADAVSPSTVIANLILENGDSVPLHACVWGTLLELNRSLTPEVLADDPLLDGYLAVILPSGTFPPKSTANQDKEGDVVAGYKEEVTNTESSEVAN